MNSRTHWKPIKSKCIGQIIGIVREKKEKKWNDNNIKVNSHYEFMHWNRRMPYLMTDVRDYRGFPIQ